ncbi:uncharacterized protein FIBRA_01210 [Fibroporia radiculosa]|uniref:Uncharacterized protein n=1 Tax=Fibroporia radiculosa TaxID=599839 RepID=J4GJK6_9APHY|nr:uncharacterized protein FIBRA_01210 [Fibroporia radiculosa]CCL99195.1 predicted protein [Fibroporia radiculosa]
MATPFSTPRYPGAPHPTPASYNSSRRVARAPILNPYDKFTQPEFDSWIDDITGALKRALGREDPLAESVTVPDPFDGDEDVAEDSFAEVVARRAAKGKERAVDMGNSEEQPIIIPSDSEDEEDAEQWEVPSEDDEDQGSALSAEEGSDGEDEAGQPSGQVFELLSDEDEEEDSRDLAISSAPDMPESGAYEEEADHEAEDFEPEDADYENEAMLYGGELHDQVTVTLNGYTVEDVDADRDLELREEIDAFPPVDEPTQPVDLPDPWVGPKTYAEDYYSGGDIPPDLREHASPHLFPTEEDTGGEVVGLGVPTAEDVHELDELREHGKQIDMASLNQLPESRICSSTFAEDLDADIPTSDLRTQIVNNVHDILTDEALTPEKQDPMSQRLCSPETAETSISMVDPHIDGASKQDTLVDFMGEPENDNDGVQRQVSSSFTRNVHSHEDPTLFELQDSAEEDEDTDSPPRPSFSSHVDWNWPPAFASGRIATGAGHLRITGLYDDGDSPNEVYESNDAKIEEVEMSAPIVAQSETSVEPAHFPELPQDDSNALPISGMDDSGHQTEIGLGPSAVAFEQELSLLMQDGRPAVAKELLLERTVDLYADLDSMPTSGGALDITTEMAIDDDIPQPLESALDDSFLEEFLASPEGPPNLTLDDDPAAASADLLKLMRDGRTEIRAGDEIDFNDSASIASSSAEDKQVLPKVELLVEKTGCMKTCLSHEMIPDTDDTAGLDDEVRADDEQIGVDAVPVGDTIDVVSVLSEEVAEITEYEVEEPVTEGRRTAEPDCAGSSRFSSPYVIMDDREGSVKANVVEYIVTEPDAPISAVPSQVGDLEDIAADDLSESTPNVPVAEVNMDGSTEQTTNAQMAEGVCGRSIMADSTLLPPHVVEDIVSPFSLSPSRATAERFAKNINSLQNAEQPNKMVTGTQHASSEAASGAEMHPMLADGVPMPISADPTVPDPASVEHTPAPAELEATPQLPAATNASTRASSITSDGPSRGKSLSGLFTPLTAENSLLDSPKARLLDIGEDKFAESPLKQSVTAEALAAAEETSLPEDYSGHKRNMVVAQDPNDEQAASPFLTPQDAGPQDAQQHDIDELILEYPSDSETVGNLVQFQSQPGGNDPFVDVHDGADDIDAEGDVDPEYAHMAEPTLIETRPQGDLPDSINELGPQDNAALAAPTTEEAYVEDSDVASTPRASPGPPIAPDVDDASAEVKGTRAKEPATLESPPLEKTAKQDDVIAPAPESPRPLKRKRMSPVLPPRLTRSMSAMHNAGRGLSRLDVGNGKGKSRENDHSDDENDAPVSASNAGDRRSVRSSHESSRASSVASAATSNESLIVPPSPTTTRTDQQHHTLPAPFIHSSGILHHHHGRPLHLQFQPQPPIERKRAPSPSLPAPRAADASAEEPAPGPSQPVTPRKMLASSPVTRSNCRFHKISLPREEDGPRVFFLVPGCSLGNGELMEEESIQDHGPAILDKDTRLVSNIEKLDFSPYLLSVLRQLVSVDLLREQEIFFWPQPGDKYQWKSRRKSKVTKATIPTLSAASRKSTGARNLPRAASVALSDTGRSAGRAPSSRAGSVSTVGSSRRKSRLSDGGSLTTTASMSASELSDLSDVEEPPVKKQKEEALPNQTVQIESDVAASVLKASAVASRRLASRKSQRLSADASAYKPGDDKNEESTDDEQTRGKRRRSTRKTTKRTRANDDDGSQSVSAPPKKRRAREKDSSQVQKDEDTPAS